MDFGHVDIRFTDPGGCALASSRYVGSMDVCFLRMLRMCCSCDGPIPCSEELVECVCVRACAFARAHTRRSVIRYNSNAVHLK